VSRQQAALHQRVADAVDEAKELHAKELSEAHQVIFPNTFIFFF
jgi:hypothetical protein